MRISNGDVDMRSLPPAQKTESPQKPEMEMGKMDVDIRNLPMEIPNLTATYKTENIADKVKDIPSDNSMTNMPSETNLTIDEKSDSGSDLPSTLPKKQRELFLRIQAQQKENLLETQNQDDDDNLLKDEDWYSSDEDNDPLSKMVIHLVSIAIGYVDNCW